MTLFFFHWGICKNQKTLVGFTDLVRQCHKSVSVTAADSQGEDILRVRVSQWANPTSCSTLYMLKVSETFDLNVWKTIKQYTIKSQIFSVTSDFFIIHIALNSLSMLHFPFVTDDFSVLSWLGAENNPVPLEPDVAVAQIICGHSDPGCHFHTELFFLECSHLHNCPTEDKWEWGWHVVNICNC